MLECNFVVVVVGIVCSISLCDCALGVPWTVLLEPRHTSFLCQAYGLRERLWIGASVRFEAARGSG